MSTVCPQRILREAIRLLEELQPFAKDDTQCEEIDNNLNELEDLARALPHKWKVETNR